MGKCLSAHPMKHVRADSLSGTLPDRAHQTCFETLRCYVSRDHIIHGTHKYITPSVHHVCAGYTGLTVGLVNTHYVLLPIPIVIQAPRKVGVARVCEEAFLCSQTYYGASRRHARWGGTTVFVRTSCFIYRHIR